jgi:predicted dehydrogenase
MQVALIGDHPDGLALARALVDTGTHQLAAYAGPPLAAEQLRRWGYEFVQVPEVEEALAQPEVEIVIVADELVHRPNVLRRALQSEHHVLCVHPADLTPDTAYEAVMIQQDTRKVLVPMLAERLGPGVGRLRQLCQQGAMGILQVIECERAFLLDQGDRKGNAHLAAWERSPLLTVWDGLRWLGGEIHEIAALASQTEELAPNQPASLTGRFEEGALLQLLLTQGGDAPHGRLLVRGTLGQAELWWPQGITGPSQLRYRKGVEEQMEGWPAWDPWPALAAVFQGQLAGRPQPLTWQDATRCLELFEAARRSSRRRRVVPLTYAEATEAENFKGTMAAVGCGLLLVVLVLFLATPLVPWLKYAILPLLLLFLVLQLLRWIVPGEEPKGQP